MRNAITLVAVGSLAGALACGGKSTPATRADTAGAAMASAPTASATTVPDWMHLDRDAKTVQLDIVAAQTGAATPFDFNGYTQGEATITVPQGYAVTIHFTNNDQAQSHSLAILSQVGDYPASFTDPQPVFAGAITTSPTATDAGTKPGESETLHFTAETAGDYAMVCVMPGHAVAGMWVHFNVSAQGEAGVSSSS